MSSLLLVNKHIKKLVLTADQNDNVKYGSFVNFEHARLSTMRVKNMCF